MIRGGIMKKRGISWQCPCCQGKIYASELQREMKCPHCFNTLYAVKNIKKWTLLIFLIILGDVLIIEPLFDLLFQDSLPHFVSSLMQSILFVFFMLLASHHCLSLFIKKQDLEKLRDDQWDASGW